MNWASFVKPLKRKEMKAIQLSLFGNASQLEFHCEDGYMKAYGEDALKVAAVLGERLYYENDVPMVRFLLVRQSDTVLPKLVRAGYCVKMLGI